MDTKRTEAKSHTLGELLAVARERAVPVVRAIPDEALDAPTPCADYDVKALVNHLFHVVVEFQKLAAKGESDFSTTPDRVGAGPDWRERFVEETGKLVAAWSVPGAEEGTAGAWQMPARLVGSMALLDLTVHVWDLARATGQDYRADDGAEPVLDAVSDPVPDAVLDPVPDPVLEQLARTVAELAPTARATGVFADPVPVAEGASVFERLLAQTGRDPYWSRVGGDEVAE